MLLNAFGNSISLPFTLRLFDHNFCSLNGKEQSRGAGEGKQFLLFSLQRRSNFAISKLGSSIEYFVYYPLIRLYLPSHNCHADVRVLAWLKLGGNGKDVPLFFSFEARQLPGESSFRPEPLREPPLEDIKFSVAIQPKDQNIPIKYLNDDQTIPQYR